LRELFKDEVRLVGEELGLPAHVLWRHPSRSGPGRALHRRNHPRALADPGEADAIVEEELRAAGLYDEVWQAFAVLLPVRSVGVMGDERTYDEALSIRAVTSQDGMTADWARLPHDVLARMSTRVTNEVRGVNRVLFDISTSHRRPSSGSRAAAVRASSHAPQLSHVAAHRGGAGALLLPRHRRP